MTTEADVVQATKQLLADYPPDTTKPQEFWGAQFDAGLAWVHFPVGRGGLGASPKLQERIDMLLREAGAPINFGINPIGVGMAAPTVLTHGSEELVDRTLRKNFTCEEVWCQLFSEPGAGSDLAALATSAVRDGDEWILNGQKVWTTLAHMATWGLVVARTDPEAPKHKGMTYFVIDMHAPGVEVRPLRQITGDAEFNEIFMTDVRIPDSYRLGEVGNGWAVSMTTLMNERASIGGAVSTRGSGVISEAVKIWKDKGHSGAAKREKLMKLWCDSEVARLTNIRASQSRVGGNPGPEQSIGKLAFAENNKKIYDFCIELLGPDGMLISDYEMRRPTSALEGGTDVAKRFLRSRANSIEGGTSEIMRNILGERVLGLPGEPRVDKDLPWSKVPARMSLRIVGAGLGRTGTNSLMTALEMILPGECHHMYKVFVHDEAETWRDIGRSSGDAQRSMLEQVMAKYVASCDWPSSAYWEQLAAANPDALILLSVRTSGEAWFKSASETIFPGIDNGPEGPWRDMVHELFASSFTTDFLDKDKAIAAYEAHNDNVRRNADPARLLEWQATDGWDPICERLGVPVPEEPFPHTNSTEDFRKLWKRDEEPS